MAMFFRKDVLKRAPDGRALFIALSLAHGLGCSARADIPEVVLTQSDVAIEGVPSIPGVSAESSLVTTSFDHPKGFELPELFESKLYALSAKAEGVGEMDDMSFVEGLTLTLASRAEGAPEPIVVARYERGQGGLSGSVMAMEIDSESNVLAYWETKSAYYDLNVWGLMPEDAWALDVTVAFSGSISLSSSD
jgi:hypothetical protein